jgi:hypothetical protein
MADENDSWLDGIGVNVPSILSSVTDTVTDVAGTVQSTASSAYDSASSAASTALDCGNTAGEAVMSAESTGWDGAKSAYNAVTGAYDSVAPNFTQSNQDLGNLVDMAEAAAKKGNESLVAEYGDVPVLGSVAKASAALSDAAIDATGGVVKGVGDLTTMAGNAMVHPIDATVSMAEGALGIAEHVPLVPGLNTTAKGIHGLVDLASGKKDGQYGSSVGDLAENLLLGTKQDPDDPSKQTNADLDFFASIGGGTKVWTEKPLEAAARTITNLAPMLLGDEGAAKPAPEAGPPSGGPPVPEPVDPFGKTQVDPFGKTQPEVPAQGPPTEVDPAKPQAEPEGPKADAANTPEQIRQNLIDASAAQKAAEQASIEATQEYVRFRANKPNPARGWEGDQSKWDPVVDEALHDQMLRAEKANIEAINNLKAAQKAARDAAGRGKGARGGGGFPPPRK